ncbi:MAG: glycerol-3-phosphate 1-O-acyltransferase PlsY [Lentisphaerae bacterium]|nr:glycerol-3-phosphate 1-O-acyltransferase PlsY [Lentisphaerota bacterium]
MTAAVIYTICGVLAYLLGAIPFGFLIARARGVDIRTVGSGNIGATNVFRAVGKGWGALVFAGDVLKGFIPVSVFPLLARKFWAYDGGELLSLMCACLAIGGHNWPVYLRFKGGKGVATSVGALLGLTPPAAGIGLLAWALVFAATRYVSVASIVAALVVAGAVWFFYASGGILLPVVLTVLCGLVIWRHKRNIQRLLAGTENRFEFKSLPACARGSAREHRPGEAG